MLPLLAAAALAVSAAPASGADGVACVLDQTSPEDVASVGDGVLSGREAGSGGAADRLTEHLAACIQRFGWDEAQTVRISTLSVTEMGRTVALQRLAAAGIDHVALDRWFAAQSEDFRTRAFVEMGEDEAAAILDRLAPGTLSPETFERHAELIGGYLAALVVALRIERGLPLQ